MSRSHRDRQHSGVFCKLCFDIFLLDLSIHGRTPLPTAFFITARLTAFAFSPGNLKSTTLSLHPAVQATSLLFLGAPTSLKIAMSHQATSLMALPNEIIRTILCQVYARDLESFAATNRRIWGVSQREDHA